MHYIPRNVSVHTHTHTHYVNHYVKGIWCLVQKLSVWLHSTMWIFKFYYSSDTFCTSTLFFHHLTLLYDSDQLPHLLVCCLRACFLQYCLCVAIKIFCVLHGASWIIHSLMIPLSALTCQQCMQAKYVIKRLNITTSKIQIAKSCFKFSENNQLSASRYRFHKNI